MQVATCNVLGMETTKKDAKMAKAQKSAIGGVTLEAAGLTLASGNGAVDDWAVVRSARKEHRCGHQKPNSRRLAKPCQHQVISKGEMYILTRQGYLDVEPLALECAIAERVITRQEDVAYIRSARTSSEPIMSSPHATIDGETTLCGQATDMVNGRFSSVSSSARCPECDRAGASVDLP